MGSFIFGREERLGLCNSTMEISTCTKATKGMLIGPDAKLFDIESKWLAAIRY